MTKPCSVCGSYGFCYQPAMCPNPEGKSAPGYCLRCGLPHYGECGRADE